MGAPVLNIDADQNSTITIPVLVQESDGTAADLTGYTGSLLVKSAHDSLITLATGTVTVNPAGAVTGVIAAADTLTWTAGVYDIMIVSGTTKEYVVRGKIHLRPTVTR